MEALLTTDMRFSQQILISWIGFLWSLLCQTFLFPQANVLLHDLFTTLNHCLIFCGTPDATNVPAEANFAIYDFTIQTIVTTLL